MSLTRYKKQEGQALVEVLIGMSMFALISSSISFLVVDSYNIEQQSSDIETATAFANEGFEAVRAIKEDNWSEILGNVDGDTHGLDDSSGNWMISGTENSYSKFTRTIRFFDVYRDAGGIGSIVAQSDPAAVMDIHTKRIGINISWEKPRTNSLELFEYMSNWSSFDWTQTDWSGGAGQNIWSNATKYESDEGNVDVSESGEIKLKETVGTCDDYIWSFNVPSNYNYDSEKIEVISGYGQLKGTVSGLITDTIIDLLEYDTSNGTYPSIVHVGGEVYAIAYTGSGNDGFVATVGISNDGQIADSVIDVFEYDTSDGRYPNIVHVSGDIYAIAYMGPGSDGFVTTIGISSNGQIADSVVDALEYDTNNGTYPSIVHIGGEVYAIAYTGSGNDGFVATVGISNNGQIADSVIDVFEYDTSDGRYPNIVHVGGEVYAVAYTGSGNNGFVATIGISNNGQIADSVIDALEYDTSDGAFSKLINISGDVYAIAYTGSGGDGFVTSFGISGLLYPTDKPDIIPASSYEPASIGTWTTFVETAEKNGGEIYYQVSDDDGATWYYWNGFDWVPATAGSYNNASVVNANLASFDASEQKIRFKAFLESDGSQLVKLDDITVGCFVGAVTGLKKDDTQSKFDQGTYLNTHYSVNSVQLTPAGIANGSGTYTSRIFNAGQSVDWGTINWKPSAPYGKQLPSNGAVETEYNSSNVDMSDNRVLIHLNESSGSEIFADDSGDGLNGSCSGSFCPTSGVAGKYYDSITFDGSDDYITVSTNLNQWLGGTASVSYWIKTTQVGGSIFWSSPGVLGVESSGNGNDIFWGYIDDTGRIGFRVGDGSEVKSTNPINNNVWHHIGMSRNHTSGFIKLYVDGQLNGQVVSDIGVKTTPFTSIGRIEDTGGSPEYYRGSLDELGVWDRILSDTEFQNIFRRGFLNIRFQVRTCDDPVCDSEIFAGPGGDSSEYYSERDNYLAGLPSFDLSGLNENRYFQYKAFFSTESPSLTPELSEISFSYSGSSTGDYELEGTLTSSAFDTGKSTNFQIINWSGSVPSCSPVCDMKLQLRVAPNLGGIPGTWTEWYGPEGIGTYYGGETSSQAINSALNGNQWIQYKVTLIGDGVSTPVFDFININYDT
ncbi:MAG: LamG domain-containing protein [Candidatus Dojkabacteria bacterium]|nr:LamG domain-containing protein [Candidatus Dojkabacteria bacterium]